MVRRKTTPKEVQCHQLAAPGVGGAGVRQRSRERLRTRKAAKLAA